MHTQGRQRIAGCGATVVATSGAHVNRRITHAVQAAVRLAPNTYAHIAIVATGTAHVTLRAPSQHGCSSQVQDVLRSATRSSWYNLSSVFDHSKPSNLSGRCNQSNPSDSCNTLAVLCNSRCIKFCMRLKHPNPFDLYRVLQYDSNSVGVGLSNCIGINIYFSICITCCNSFDYFSRPNRYNALTCNSHYVGISLLDTMTVWTV